MSLVTCPLRNSFASGPVSASLPRSERSSRPQPSVSVAYSAPRRSVSVRSATPSRIARRTGWRRPRRVAHRGTASFPAMGLADDFQKIVDSLPDDWTDLELDLRIADESRYVEAAVYLVDLQRAALLPPRLALAAARRPPLRARRLGSDRARHAALCSTKRGSRASSPCASVRSGRAEVMQMWGRPQSAREEFRAAARAVGGTRWRACSRWSRTCCSARACRALCGGGQRGRADRRRGAAAGTARGPDSAGRGRAGRGSDRRAARRRGDRGIACRRRACRGQIAHAGLLLARGCVCTRARRAGRIRPRGAAFAHGSRGRRAGRAGLARFDASARRPQLASGARRH